LIHNKSVENNSDIFTITIKPIIPIWHNIHISRVDLSEGYRWKIGDESNIKVWAEPWVRMRIGLGRLDDPLQDSEYLIVKDIMNREQKVLDENVIQVLFDKDEKKGCVEHTLYKLVREDARIGLGRTMEITLLRAHITCSRKKG